MEEPRVTVETEQTGKQVATPGSLVRVRDETWLVTSVRDTADGPLYEGAG